MAKNDKIRTSLEQLPVSILQCELRKMSAPGSPAYSTYRKNLRNILAKKLGIRRVGIDDAVLLGERKPTLADLGYFVYALLEKQTFRMGYAFSNRKGENIYGVRYVSGEPLIQLLGSVGDDNWIMRHTPFDNDWQPPATILQIYKEADDDH